MEFINRNRENAVENDLKQYTVEIRDEFYLDQLGKYYNFEELTRCSYFVYKLEKKDTGELTYITATLGDLQQTIVTGFLLYEQGLQIENSLAESRRNYKGFSEKTKNSRFREFKGQQATNVRD